MQSVVQKMLDMILPPRCFACGDEVQSHHSQCVSCWGKMTFITDPQCYACGIPFDYKPSEIEDEGDDVTQLVCGDCAVKPHAFDQARAVFLYDDHSKNMILAFKHGDRQEGVPAFANWLLSVTKPWKKEISLIMPVPLHWRRLFKRRFNQSAEMAHALSGLSGWPVDVTSLKRHKPTRSQFGLGARQRQKNVHAAFSLTNLGRANIAGQTILLLDDVMTTGATLDACAKVLKKAGAKKVYAVSLARVVNSA